MVDDGFHMDAWQEVERAFRIAMQKSYEKMIKESREHAEHNARMTVLKAQAVAAQKQTIIPFCHNTPGNKALAPAMPQAIYDKAVGMGKSSILSIGTRISATGATVPNRNYKRDKAGDEFSRGKKKYLSSWPLLAGLAPIRAGHKTDIYAGMRRMETSTGKSKSSAYLTFRVMHEDSTGWIVPAKSGLKLADKIAAQIESQAQGYIESVVKDALG